MSLTDATASQVSALMSEVEYAVSSKTDSQMHRNMARVPLAFPRFMLHNMLRGAAFGIWESVLSGGKLPNVTHHP